MVSTITALIYSSIGVADKGGSEGKINKGGTPAVQGWKDHTPGV